MLRQRYRAWDYCSSLSSSWEESDFSSEAAKEFARRNGKLGEDLVDWLAERNDQIQGALPEIERVGMSRYITRMLYESYDLDYNEAENMVMGIQERYTVSGF